MTTQDKRTNTDNVIVTLNGRGFVVTREEILDNVGEAMLLERFRELMKA